MAVGLNARVAGLLMTSLAVSVSLHAEVIGLNANLDLVHRASLENRRDAFAILVDPYRKIPKASVVNQRPDYLRDPADWVEAITATVFWVGEQATENNPVPNHKSAWDQNWQANFGGFDDPRNRDGYWPREFKPKLNPFYIALPYNDVMSGGRHRPEASKVIPNFWEDYQGPGISVLKGRWVAVQANGRTAYAQWEDVGPFVVDHWQYVFGFERPKKNRNKQAGIDLSPAMRDFLKLRGGYGQVRWRFVEEEEVPQGPWSQWVEKLPLPR